MDELQYPVNFVIPQKRSWTEIDNDEIYKIDDFTLSQRCVGATANWVIIPYVYFRRAGYNVSYSTLPINGHINIAAGLDLGIRSHLNKKFILACRADGNSPILSNFVFEQNGLNSQVENVAWVPHPPQPGLIPRNPSRGHKIEALTFKGDITNLHLPFRDDEFRKKLKYLGVTLDISPRTLPKDVPLRMHDYENSDAVFAIRNLTVIDAKVKPASKLLNAWKAGTPALLGPEPAFQELRKSPLDYIEVRTPDDVLHAIEYLISNPQIYKRMIENGFQRSAGISAKALVQGWVDLINGRVGEEFRNWEAHSSAHKIIRRTLLVPSYRYEKRTSRWHRFNGPRILD